MRAIFSDDTEQSFLVAQSLLIAGDDVEVFQRALKRRLIGWFLSLPPGVGLGTVRSIVKLMFGGKTGVATAGNGAAGEVGGFKTRAGGYIKQMRLRPRHQAQDAARSGWAVIPWATLGPEGEAQLAESAITVRCLTMPDGSVPASDDEPGVMAVVGRAY